MTSSRRETTGYRALALYLGAVFIGGSLVAPWLYGLVHVLAPHVPLLQPLARYPFHRYVDRSVLLVALVGLRPFWLALGLRSWRDLGIPGEAGRARRLAMGLGLSFGTLALASALELAAGARTLNPDISLAMVVHRLSAAAVSAVAVSALEETLFRGVLFGGLRRATSWQGALVLSSVIYAGVHFLQPPVDPGVVTWSSGLHQLGAAFAGLGRTADLVPSFFNLTVAGALFAVAYHRTGDLWCSFGLHAGWILWIRCYGVFTADGSPLHAAYWGSAMLLDGWLALVVLVGTLGALHWLLPAQVQEEPGGD